MILLEQHIELKIFHGNELRKYDVVELLRDDEGMSFNIFYKERFLFSLIPTLRKFLSFELSGVNKGMSMDWKLHYKIEASLFSIFLKAPLS